VYLPHHFSSSDIALAHQLIQQHPFASLVSNDDDGFPFVTHLPIHLDLSQPGFALQGHVAKGNPHWRFLKSRPQALVTFVGPHAYLSPKVYPDLARVPTWNYVALHCKVNVILVTEAAEKDQLLKQLIGDHEPDYAAQWRALPDDFAEKMLAGMVAFRLEVVSWQLKLKLNQHRPEAKQTTLDAYESGNPNERELAQWMRQMP
jgi:transcriptional regulator